MGEGARNVGLSTPPPQASPSTSEVALVAEGGRKDPFGDHTAAVAAHQLALRIMRVFHELRGAAVRAAAAARHLTIGHGPPGHPPLRRYN